MVVVGELAVVPWVHFEGMGCRLVVAEGILVEGRQAEVADTS